MEEGIRIMKNTFLKEGSGKEKNKNQIEQI